MKLSTDEKINQIHEILAGSLEKPGLVHKVADLEQDVKHLNAYKKSDQKMKQKAAGGLAVIIPFLVAAAEWLKSKLFS